MSDPHPRPNVRRMIGIVTLVVVAGIIGVVCWRVDDWGRDWTTNSATESFEFSDQGIETTVKKVQQWVDGNSNWQLLTERRSDGEAKLHLTRSTSVFKFTDDVHLTIRSVDQNVVIQATSKSRIGKGDLGQNPRNLAELAGAFR